MTLRRKTEEATRETARGRSEATPVRALGGVMVVVGAVAAVIVAVALVLYLAL